jgi:hypothetical protein
MPIPKIEIATEQRSQTMHHNSCSSTAKPYPGHEIKEREREREQTLNSVGFPI